jgi:ATP-dependent protease ClpP protease subunit
MENNILNTPQQKTQPSLNQAQSSTEPINPFIFSGTPNNNEDGSQPIENVKQIGSITQVEPVKDICFISIIGEIEGHSSLPPQSKTTKYEHIIPMIIGAEMDPQIKGVLLLINTMGGDVEAGLAISELIASITKPTVSIVLGGGHSIGTALAVSADYSFIAPTGTMTIHPIRTSGLVIGVPQTFRYFQKMQERITNFIVSNSHVDKQALLDYMYDTDEIANDVGTVLNADEVVSIGLIDEIGGFSKAMKKLRELIDNMEEEG